MNENMSEYKDIINLMEATPKAPVPDHFTQNVMGRLSEEQSLSIWQLLRHTLAEAGEISWTRFAGECTEGRNACFYFLLAGIFFFFIGSTLVSSIFYTGPVSRAMNPILIQAFLVLTAATLLIIAGLIIAANLPGSAQWAKRAIMLFGFLVVANAMFINMTVKTMSGGVLALTFGIAGIVTGMILMKALETQKQGKNVIFTGGLHNA
jgi:hypothetical protein